MNPNDSKPPVRYVIITPMRNEGPYMEQTIKGVASQSMKPVRWVIVDDASDDQSAEIVARYLNRLDFLTLVRLERSGNRNFAGKVGAFNAGLNCLDGTMYSFIANLDADIFLEPDYYRNILAKFEKDAKLGLAGGIVLTRIGSRFYTDDKTLDSVGGAVQVFRRECFEQIGGYLALPGGGIDAAAEIMARMKGWKVRKFPENKVWESRRTGSAGNGLLTSMYKLGVRFHTLGYGTGFFILRSFYKVKSRPFVLGSVAMLLGFLLARLRSYPVSLPPEVVSYLRSEQQKTLRRRLSGIVSRATTRRT